MCSRTSTSSLPRWLRSSLFLTLIIKGLSFGNSPFVGFFGGRCPRAGFWWALSADWVLVSSGGFLRGVVADWVLVSSCGFWWGVAADWVLVSSCGFLRGVVADWVLVSSGGFWWGVAADWVLVSSCGFLRGVVRWYGPRYPHKNLLEPIRTH